MITLFISRWLKPCKVLHLLAQLLLLFLVFFGWSLPVHAASQSSVSSRLEDQVLQIIRDRPDARDYRYTFLCDEWRGFLWSSTLV